MIHRLAALLASVASLACAAAPGPAPHGMPSRPALPMVGALAPSFRAPGLAAVDAVSLPALVAKAATPPNPRGPQRVGSVRELGSPVPVARWVRVAGGWVAKVRATSDGALGLRVRLDLGTMPGAMELRAQGGDGRIETMMLDPTLGPQAWTPWTEGPSQVIELFTPVRPGNGEAVSLGAIAHFDTPVFAKAAGFCTLEAMCAATDSTLDPGVGDAILERRKSVARISFVSGTTAYVCSATLIDTEKYPAPYVLTANHCIGDGTTAGTITAWWSYESDNACPDQGLPPTREQTSGGMQLVLTNFNVDSTLLLMNQAPPSDTVYAGWNSSELGPATSIVSVSHPQGDTTRYAVGTATALYPLPDWPQEFYVVSFSHGIIQGGSSGSGLFTMSGGSLELRGILTATTTNNSAEGLSCTDLNEVALYSRFDIFEPELTPYITAAGKPADDAPNRPQDLFGTPPDPTGAEVLDARTTADELDNRLIDYPGDLDVYRFVLNSSAWVSAWTDAPGGANLDTVGTLLDSKGDEITFNDDAQTSSYHFGFTQQLAAGTYYVQVAHWDPSGTGAYNLHMRADHLDANYTDLWWNSAESGWGLNLNHQSNIIFATLFTYDSTGAPMWLVMSDGERQADGSYLGTLYRTTGPAFSAQPFNSSAVSASAIGSMRLTFTGSASATLVYTYNGTTVTKSITRQPFSTPPTCTWSAFDRSYATNYQDLWWNPSESGWGVNIAHQGDILFATLFTYGSDGKGMWLVMSDGARTGNASYSGTLYRTTGPAFNASPWTAISATPVGTMSFHFADGNTGTLTYTVNGVTVTKSIQRQAFGVMKTQCES